MASVQRKFDSIHGYIDRVEDVLLSESSWSTTDSECSGCLHLLVPLKEFDKANTGIEQSSLYKKEIYNCSCKRNHKMADIRTVGEDLNSQMSSSLSASGIRFSSSTLASDSSLRPGMLQQLSLLAAGAQPWHRHICTSHGKRFAYAATLVIYVYEAEEGSSEWQLCSILSEHRKTITGIDWHPTNEDLIASSSLDQRICVWSVSRQVVVCAISICQVPIMISWCPKQRDLLSFSTCNGPIQLWQYTENNEPFPFREDYGYANGIAMYHWHPSVPGRLVVGHHDGKISVYREDVGKVRYSAFPEGIEEDKSLHLVAVEWDVHSPDYLLLAYKNENLWLVDVNNMHIVTKFVLPRSSSVCTLGWLPSAPGMFITGDAEMGILRIWNVSKSTPMENITLKSTSFHVLCVIKTTLDDRYNSKNVFSPDDKKINAIPNAAIVCLFEDGGVGIYHLKRKEWVYKREYGHTETIFDCSFKPGDSDLLATASFDGSIKIWRIDTMESVNTMPKRPSIIYSVSWAPADLNCLVAGTSAGEIFIWNPAKHKVIKEICPHQGKKIFCVSWNQKDARYIASVGEAGYCYVHQVCGTIVQEYSHPGPVYGCDWKDGEVLATGCEDGKIRIFNIIKNKKDPSVILKGHVKKVFRVKWNPVYSDILCSGSDDTSIKVWSVSKAQCIGVLVGHSDNVRGLAWCPEVPFLLVSGSWDRTLRIWNAQTFSCLDVVLDHGADVYGLSIHPVRPFLLASCSRDSTLRLWSLASFVSCLQLKVLAGKPIEEVIKGEDAFLNSSDMFLSGLRADHLQSTLKRSDVKQRFLKRYKLFADLFCADVRSQNLWDLIYVLQGHTDLSALSPNYSSSVIHHSHLLKCNMAKAAENKIELNHSFGIGVRNVSNLEVQETLAKNYLSCGSLQQYCELMVSLNKWDQALAIAPAISVDYWRQLINKQAELLVQDDNEECIPYLLASQNFEKLINFYVGRGHLDKAFSSCIAFGRLHRVQHKPDNPPRPHAPEINGALNEDAVRWMSECSSLLCEQHLKRGSPITAACCQLAFDNIEGALLALLRGHELELVVSVGRILKNSFSSKSCKNASTLECLSCHAVTLVNTAVTYLVYRAERLCLWELAVDLAKTLPEGQEQTLLIAHILISFTGGHDERESLHVYAGFPLPIDCPEYATGNIVDQIIYNMLSTQPHKGFNQGIEYIKDAVTSSGLDRNSVWHVLFLLQAASLCSSSNYSVKIEQRSSFLALSAFMGAIKSYVQGYHSVVVPLFSHASCILEKYKLSNHEFLRDRIGSAIESWDISNGREIGISVNHISESWSDRGLTKVTGSHLPRHSDSHICCITQEIIKGPSYILENGESVVGLNSALMWAKVHPFSPIGTGHRLNPF